MAGEKKAPKTRKRGKAKKREGFFEHLKNTISQELKRKGSSLAEMYTSWLIASAFLIVDKYAKDANHSKKLHQDVVESVGNKKKAEELKKLLKKEDAEVVEKLQAVKINKKKLTKEQRRKLLKHAEELYGDMVQQMKELHNDIMRIFFLPSSVKSVASKYSNEPEVEETLLKASERFKKTRKEDFPELSTARYQAEMFAEDIMRRFSRKVERMFVFPGRDAKAESRSKKKREKGRKRKNTR